MLAVIEGVDRTGKSILAEWLSLEMPGRVIHKGRPEKHPLDEYEQDLLKHDPRGSKHLALDRWHVGERVWPQIFGRETEYDLTSFKHTEMFLRSRGGVLVYCERSFIDLISAIRSEESEPDQLKKSATLREALRLYEEALADRACPLIRRTHGTHIGPLLRGLHDAQRGVERVHAVTDRWVGHPRPTLLMVGSDGSNAPTFMPRDPYRRSMFEEALRLAGDDWTTCAVADTVASNGQRAPLHSLWLAMGRPRVAALDDEAVGLLHDARVPRVDGTVRQKEDA